MKKILFVEDEMALLETYSEILKSEGYDVIQSEDGYKGLDALKAHKEEVGLVYLDLMMEGIDGLETLKKIKESPEEYGNPHIIILTNMTSERVIKEAFNLGANSYLIKSELEASDLLKNAQEILK